MRSLALRSPFWTPDVSSGSREQAIERIHGVRARQEPPPFVQNGVGNMLLLRSEDDRLSAPGLDPLLDRLREARRRAHLGSVVRDVPPDVACELGRIDRAPIGSLDH